MLKFYLDNTHIFNVVTMALFIFLVLYITRRAGPGLIYSPKIRHYSFVMFLAAATTAYFIWDTLFLQQKTTSLYSAALFLIPGVICISLLLTLFLIFLHAPLYIRFGKLWVKGLDFFYLAFASFGLLRLFNASPHITERVSAFENLGLLLVAVAISIRLTKATIEVFFDPWYNH